jgi:hypothetical protein
METLVERAQAIRIIREEEFAAAWHELSEDEQRRAASEIAALTALMVGMSAPTVERVLGYALPAAV